MSNSADAARKIVEPVAPMPKHAVRKVLDAVKADKRTSLTAPEGKLVCDAYGIPVPKEGVAKSASEEIVKLPVFSTFLIFQLVLTLSSLAYQMP